MESIDTKTCYVVNPDVVLREEDPDGGLLFNPDTNQIKVVNTTGLFVWKRCDGKKPVDDIIAEMKEAFDEVPADQVTQDVTRFIEELVASGFLGVEID